MSPGELFIAKSTLTHSLMGPDPCFTPPSPILSPTMQCGMVKDKEITSWLMATLDMKGSSCI